MTIDMFLHNIYSVDDRDSVRFSAVIICNGDHKRSEIPVLSKWSSG